jgi:hypothetical protein
MTRRMRNVEKTVPTALVTKPSDRRDRTKEQHT